MTTLAGAFLADIIANPADDTPRLIFADWLEDNGEPERAEFIRCQVELAKGNGCDPRPLHNKPCRRCSMIARERELLVRHREEWFRLLSRRPGLGKKHPLRWWPVASNGEERLDRGSDCPVLSEAIEASPRRGFLAEIECSCADWMRWGPAIVREAPIENVRLADKEPTQYDRRDGGAGRPDRYQSATFWRWFEQGADEPPQYDLLPAPLWKVIHRHPDTNDYDGFWEFATKQIALTALSIGCRRWAREQPCP